MNDDVSVIDRVGIDPGDGSGQTSIVRQRHLVRRCREQWDSVDQVYFSLSKFPS